MIPLGWTVVRSSDATVSCGWIVILNIPKAMNEWLPAHTYGISAARVYIHVFMYARSHHIKLIRIEMKPSLRTRVTSFSNRMNFNGKEIIISSFKTQHKYTNTSSTLTTPQPSTHPSYTINPLPSTQPLFIPPILPKDHTSKNQKYAISWSCRVSNPGPSAISYRFLDQWAKKRTCKADALPLSHNPNYELYNLKIIYIMIWK